MKSAMKPKKVRLTVYLIKETFKESKDFIKSEGFKQVIIKQGDLEIGTLYYKGGFKNAPSWVAIFTGTPGFDSSLLFNQSSKAVFVMKHEGRWFCITFGHARHLIDDLAYERNFGLYVTLNLSDPSAIRSIDKTNISHVSLNSREQATRNIELTSFEFNNDIDLLKSVTARASSDDGEEQETLSGRDSVTITAKAGIGELPAILKRLYKAYESNQYKKRYPWLGKIREERDSQVIERLDDCLVQKIVDSDFSKIWLAIPEVISWEHIHGFSFNVLREKQDAESAALAQDLDIEEWRNGLRSKDTISAKQLKSKKVYVYYEDGRAPASWSVYRCLNAEIDLDGNTYILNDGDWYKIDLAYVREINAYFVSIPDSSIVLPQYGTKTEPKYLIHVSKRNPNYALMDRKEIMLGGGRSRVEFCDLYSNAKQIIHVKKYGGSSVLSHLFSQALVSGDCFLHESHFRFEVNKLLPASFRLSNPTQQPVASDYEVCIAIMSKEKGPLEIPFFSKVSLKFAATALGNLGYSVTKLKIAQ